MEGNAKIIKFIARDENIHLAFTQQLIRALPKSDLTSLRLQSVMEESRAQIFRDVAQQEKGLGEVSLQGWIDAWS
jgi:ribonucleoside-diphosphate reductase beta chain